MITSTNYIQAPTAPVEPSVSKGDNMKKVTPHDDVFAVINDLVDRVNALDGKGKEDPKPTEEAVPAFTEVETGDDKVVENPTFPTEKEVKEEKMADAVISPIEIPAPADIPPQAQPDSSFGPVTSEKNEPATVEEAKASVEQAEKDPRFDVKPAAELIEGGVEIENPAKVEETKKGTEGSKPEQTI